MTPIIRTNNFYVRVSKPQPITFDNKMDNLISKICELSGYSISELKGRGRKTDITTWRHIAIFIACARGWGGKRQIGLYFGGKHWATVINAEKRVSNHIEVNDQIVMSRLSKLNAFFTSTPQRANPYVYHKGENW